MWSSETLIIYPLRSRPSFFTNGEAAPGTADPPSVYYPSTNIHIYLFNISERWSASGGLQELIMIPRFFFFFFFTSVPANVPSPHVTPLHSFDCLIVSTTSPFVSPITHVIVMLRLRSVLPITMSTYYPTMANKKHMNIVDRLRKRGGDTVTHTLWLTKPTQYTLGQFNSIWLIEGDTQGGHGRAAGVGSWEDFRVGLNKDRITRRRRGGRSMAQPGRSERSERRRRRRR